MKEHTIMIFIYLLFFIATSNSRYIDNTESEKVAIVGGKVALIQDIPYQASLFQNGLYKCGATILSDTWIVTAAHCTELSSNTSFIVRTGSSLDYCGGTYHGILEVVSYPDYNPITLHNDISLIKLMNPMTLNKYQQPIPFARPFDVPQAGQILTISGFGSYNSLKPRSATLKMAKVPVVDNSSCELSYQKTDPITDSMFCAGDGKTDACTGDSGGPAVIDGRLIGIISSGHKCASAVYPGVYTSIYKFHSWITNITGIVE